MAEVRVTIFNEKESKEILTFYVPFNPNEAFHRGKVIQVLHENELKSIQITKPAQEYIDAKLREYVVEFFGVELNS